MNQGQITVPLNLFKEHVCTCGGIYFDQRFKVKVYDGALAPTALINAQQELFCLSCGNPLTIEKPSLKLS